MDYENRSVWLKNFCYSMVFDLLLDLYPGKAKKLFCWLLEIIREEMCKGLESNYVDEKIF